MRVMGFNINRDTIANSKRGGLSDGGEKHLFPDIVTLVVVYPQKRRNN
jgi:hypothetical protein